MITDAINVLPSPVGRTTKVFLNSAAFDMLY